MLVGKIHAWNSYLVKQWWEPRFAEVLADYFGTDFISFSTTSGGAYPDITRSLVSFSAARTKTRYRASWPKFIIGRISRKDSKWDSAFGNYVFQSYLKPLP